MTRRLPRSHLNNDVIEAQEPAGFRNGTLRDYQLLGFRWLVARFLFGEGAILVCEFPQRAWA